MAVTCSSSDLQPDESAATFDVVTRSDEHFTPRLLLMPRVRSAHVCCHVFLECDLIWEAVNEPSYARGRGQL